MSVRLGIVTEMRTKDVVCQDMLDWSPQCRCLMAGKDPPHIVVAAALFSKISCRLSSRARRMAQQVQPARHMQSEAAVNSAQCPTELLGEVEQPHMRYDKPSCGAAEEAHCCQASGVKPTCVRGPGCHTNSSGLEVQTYAPSRLLLSI